MQHIICDFRIQEEGFGARPESIIKQDNICKEPVIGDFVNGQVTRAAAFNLKVDQKNRV